MKKILQINVVVNWTSTGYIAESIGDAILSEGWESYISYGRGKPASNSKLIRIGNSSDMYFHAAISRISDSHGLYSRTATLRFIEEIKKIRPNIIHIHVLHGYYINYRILFNFLREYKKPVIWTLHDCWPFTGHCAYFDYANCNKWKTKCEKCPNLGEYPKSLFMDGSSRNYALKKESFTQIENMTLVPVSNWLGQLVSESFLNKYPIKIIHNGIDTKVFRPKKNSILDDTYFIILGVASDWEKRKGLDEFIYLRSVLPSNYRILILGLNDLQIKKLPIGIEGHKRTSSVNELVDYYNQATVYVNPTFEDNFPTTNLEALACGTPVITYNTGGSPESIDSETGIVVEKGNREALIDAIKKVVTNGKMHYSEKCREKAIANFRREDRFRDYIMLYRKLLKNNI